MRIAHQGLVAFTLGCLILSGGAVAADDNTGEAVTAAERWLSLVDKGQYGQSWEQAASIFKGRVPKSQWEQQVAGVRGPLGKVLSRKLRAKQLLTSAPGVPDGQYVVIDFDTSFENKPASAERITPMKDKDGSWRVSGYFIR